MTKKHFETEQEQFWAGEFGTEYIERNRGDALLASNLNFFNQALKSAGKITSCIEFGANIGMNLKALKLLHPGLKLQGIEINEEAAKQLSDVVGMIVAPALLATILRWKGHTRFFVAHLLIALGFGAINLFPEVARLLSQSLALVGIPYRIWTDPSDLLALPVLLLSWHFFTQKRVKDVK